MAQWSDEFAVLRGRLGADPVLFVQPMLELALELAMVHEQRMTTLQSGLGCKIAFQLAMGAGMAGQWAQAAVWLEKSLEIPRALTQINRPKAQAMLIEARQRAGAQVGGSVRNAESKATVEHVSKDTPSATPTPRKLRKTPRRKTPVFEL